MRIYNHTRTMLLLAGGLVLGSAALAAAAAPSMNTERADLKWLMARLTAAPGVSAALHTRTPTYPHTRLAAVQAPIQPSTILPDPAGRKVDFFKDVHPILQDSCGGCHLNGSAMGGFTMDTREKLLKGGADGAAVVPGDSAHSLLIRMVAGLVPGKLMPMTGARLTAEQVAVLRAWIDQGVSFGAGAEDAAAYIAPLEPRRPLLPPGPDGMNPIDRLVQVYFRQNHVQPGPVVDDRTYARRVYLDVLGLIPTPEQLQAFENDPRADKRQRLVEELLSHDHDYALHWMAFWNDLLRNDYAGTGYIDGGRKQITQWLYHALESDMPYNQFVSELVDPVPGSEGFINGIVWRGTVNASQTPQMQAAQNISQVFLGINMKCASCHDSFISSWKLTDSYGMAGIYADHPLEIVRCDNPTGKIAPVKFLYPQLGAIDPNAPRPDRLKQLAAALTSPQDGRLTRTIVNRLWSRFFGRGLVEPVDEMDNRPWDADLLDWLASSLSDNGYDLKKVEELILTSRAYQLPPMRDVGERPTNFVFAGPLVRRMSAEEFVDSVRILTGAWPTKAAANLGSQSGVQPAGRWIWNDPRATTAVPGERIYLRKSFDLAATPGEAWAAVTCDNEFTLYVNGKQAGHSDDWMHPLRVDLKPFLVPGKNVLAVEAINWPDPVTGKGSDVAKGPNPGGFYFQAMIVPVPANDAGPQPAPATTLASAAPRAQDPAPGITVASDGSWKASGDKVDGWEQPAFDDANWKAASDLGDANVGPWGAGGSLAAALEPPSGETHIRAVLENADPLTIALGRPNRDQVVTMRAAAASTLQALELTNGRTLAQMLQTGAQNWIAGSPEVGGTGTPAASSADLVSGVFLRAIGRKPTPAELGECQPLVGSPARSEGVQDLLWAVVMHPEFQLIE